MQRYFALLVLLFCYSCVESSPKLFFYIQKQEDTFYKDENSLKYILPKKPSLFHLASESLYIYTDQIIHFYYRYNTNILQRLRPNSNTYFILYKQDNPWTPTLTITDSKQQKRFSFTVKDLEENNYTLYIQNANSQRKQLLQLYVREYEDTIDYNSTE